MDVLAGPLDEGLLLGLLAAAPLQLLEVLFPQLAHSVCLVHKVEQALLVVGVMHEELGLQGKRVLQGPLEVYYVVYHVLHRKYSLRVKLWVESSDLGESGPEYFELACASHLVLLLLANLHLEVSVVFLSHVKLDARLPLYVSYAVQVDEGPLE